MLFAERKGHRKVKSKIQLSEIDEETRNKIWNALQLFVWKERNEWMSDFGNQDVNHLMQLYWHSYFKKPLDTLPYTWTKNRTFLREYFFSCLWFDLFSFLEFLFERYEHPQDYENKAIPALVDFINDIFESELVGYRIVNKMITEITSTNEIQAIESSINDADQRLIGVSKHLERALELLSDRKNPDYRNSIKESISAVESSCKAIAKDEKATLGKALQIMEDKIALHPALKSAFSNLYGYTSDEKGIRHALSDVSEIQFEDAKFMLVSCSSFINYLKSKIQRAKLKFI